LNFKNIELSSGHSEFVSADVVLSADRDQVDFKFNRPMSADKEILNKLIMDAFES